MTSINKPVVATPEFTHGGAKVHKINKALELKRSVMSTLLWEDQFYEDGVSISDRIASLIPDVAPAIVAEIAIEAREKMKLRHVPLFVVRQMAKLPTHKGLVGDVLPRIIKRADELAEFLAIYWKEGKQPISKQVKKGLATAFTKFDEYSLAKYNRDNAIKLRDVLFLTHAKPKDQTQEALWKKLVDDTLAIPDTWEVELSASKDKKASWERLLTDKRLFALALIRNLRNMEQAGVDRNLIKDALKNTNPEWVLPYRFISAAKHAPGYEPELEEAMFKCLASKGKLPGKTVLIIDVSGSMGGMLSGKSEMNRMGAAASIAILAREMCDDVRIYATAGNDGTMIHKTALVPARRGFALSDAVLEQARNLGGGGIFLTQVMDYTLAHEKNADRVIVFTDEQDCDRKLSPDKANAWGKIGNYIVNIASFKNGVGYGKFTKIDGWSEATLDYIREFEYINANTQTTS